jgi:hypothetical protein
VRGCRNARKQLGMNWKSDLSWLVGSFVTTSPKLLKEPPLAGWFFLLSVR